MPAEFERGMGISADTWSGWRKLLDNIHDFLFPGLLETFPALGSLKATYTKEKNLFLSCEVN